MSEPILVLKFGGSVLTGASDVRRAVDEVYRFHRRGVGVVAVVSAFHGTTDRLLALGRAQRTDDPGLAELLASGEREAATALSRALARSGVRARLLDPIALGFAARGPRFDADPAAIDCSKLEAAIEGGGVAIVPGFFGIGEDGGIALLGRGGSDLSALFLASRLGARCRLVKDVPALFEWDPAAPGPFRPRAYEEVSFGTAQRVGGRVLQPKAIAFARRHELRFEIADWNSSSPTLVGASRDRFRGVAPRRRLRVGLLGNGAVGAAVREALDASPDTFELSRILVRDRARHPGDARVTDDPETWFATPFDVAVLALGGVGPAADLAARCLKRRICVVTANKTLVSDRGVELAAIARDTGARFLASACVGGAVPVLETAVRLAPELRRVEGSLNGTSAFVADRLARGRSLEHALRTARRHGLAEEDPGKDLSGADAAEKLRVLARALGVEVEPVAFAAGDLERSARAARERGAALAQVAVLERADGAWRARVEWREVAIGRGGAECVDPDRERATTRADRLRRARALAADRAGNEVEFESVDGRRVRLTGAGAGGPPTATAILADLLDLARRFDPNSVSDEDFPGTPVPDTEARESIPLAPRKTAR